MFSSVRHLLTCGAIATTALTALSPSAFAQSAPRPISLVDMARFYSEAPQQTRALQLLEQQIEARNPALLSGDAIVANVWRNTDVLLGHQDILSDISAENRTGADPLQLAIAVANPSPGAPLNIEVLSDGGEVRDSVVITLIESNLLDDSVEAILYRFDITAQNDQWTIQRAGRQFRCQTGRGQQDFAASLCS